MPRRPRLNLAGLPLHIIQRGNNRHACFYAEEDYRFYLHWLALGASKHGCVVHAYVLMTNHVHLLLTPETPGAASTLMQSLGRRYVQYVNRFYRRSGTLWEGRFRASLVNADEYLLTCMRYIELNPVRAAMVGDPSSYTWSSHGHNGLGRINDLIGEHELYKALGANPAERRAAYVQLFRSELDPTLLTEIRGAANGGLALGGQRFKDEVAAALGMKEQKGKPGRRRAGAFGFDGEQVEIEI